MDTISSGHGHIARQGEQIAFQGDPTHDRQVIARVIDSQEGRLPSRRVRSDASGQQVETRFIHKNQRAPFQSGLFFNSPQTSARHVAMAPSSRWLARSNGICGVQFNSLSKRATWDLWYTIPHSHAMTLPIREHVHTSPRNPY